MTNQEAIEKFKKIKRGSIFLIHQRIEGKEVIEDYSLCDMTISALQAQYSPKPTAGSVQNVQNEDLISRKAAIDAIEKNAYRHTYLDHIIDIVSELPPAQPERKNGEWTKDCACKICGFKPWYERDIHTLSFCPNCGADNREDNDDQSK